VLILECGKNLITNSIILVSSNKIKQKIYAINSYVGD